MDRPNDMWAWARERPEVKPAKVDASNVLAVLVVHNGEQWLPRTLVGLARLDAQPGRLIAVDAGSVDGSRKLLDKGRHDGLLHSVLDGKPDEGFGANVQLAVDAALADGFEPSLLWFLHDDSAPSRHALTELLIAADDLGGDERRPAILVPKLLHPKRRNHPDQMSAVGESIARSGARVLTVEPGDIDQHQLSPARVLGASTAGMLVRMDAWQELGGFDPAVPLFRDGVDLGWRANARGMKVRTCPKASLRHVEAGRVGLRDSVLAPDSAQADKVAGMSVVVMHAEKPRRTLARLQVQSVLMAFGYLLGKSPSMAAGQLRAMSEVRAKRDHLVEVAERFTATGSDEVPEGLLPDRGWGVRRFFDNIGGAISDRYHDLVEDHDTGLIDELTGDDFAGGRRTARFLSPAIVGMIVMLVASFVASRHLLRTGWLSGPALLPAPPALGDAWAGWVQAVPGMAGSNAPWLGLMALGAMAAFGQPDWWATLLVLGGPALAGWAAFSFLRPILGPGWWTPVLASLWGALLPLLGATGRGSLDLSILAIGLPLLAMAVRRWTNAPTIGADGLRAPAAAALLIGILAAFMPWIWLPGLVLGALMAWRRRDVRGGLVVALGPIVLLGPWLPRLFADPGRLLTGADPASQVAGNPPSALHVLIGSPHLPGAPIYLGIAGVGLLWVVGLLGAVRARGLDPSLRVGLVATALLAPVLAVLVTRFVVPAAGIEVRPDPTGWSLIGLFALVVLAAHGIGRRPERGVDDTADDAATRAQMIRTRSLLGMTAGLALLAAGAWWVIGGASQLSRQHDVLPSYVIGVQVSDRATRTLMVDLSGGTARYNITSATTPAWGTAENPIPFSEQQAQAELLQAAQQFAQGQPSDDLFLRLEQLGIAHVWMRGATAEAISELSSAPQLGVAPADQDTVIFTVTTQPGRAMFLPGGSKNEQPIKAGTVPSGPSGSKILLSEPADPAWQAELDGVRLAAAESGDWRQAWSTEGRSGTLVYRLTPDVVGTTWQTAVLLLLIVLAAPTAQRSHAPRRALAPQSTRTAGSNR